MQIVLQTLFAILWIIGLIALVVGIWYGGSMLVLAVVSRLLPLTGRQSRSRRDSVILPPEGGSHPRE